MRHDKRQTPTFGISAEQVRQDDIYTATVGELGHLISPKTFSNTHQRPKKQQKKKKKKLNHTMKKIW